jgi:hypothetical protein
MSALNWIIIFVVVALLGQIVPAHASTTVGEA